MPHGIVNYGVRISIACMAMAVFFFIREGGFYLYTENIKSIHHISRQRDLYYSIHLTSFYVAMPILFISNIINFKFRWHFFIALIYVFFVFYSYFIQHPMWGWLLIISYLGALSCSVFFHLVMKGYIFKR